MLVSVPFREFVHRIVRTFPKRRRARVRRSYRGALGATAAMVETLEHRQLLSATPIVVNSAVDVQNYASNVTAAQLNNSVTPVSLRDAVNAANNTSGATTIMFDPGLFAAGQVMNITLAGSMLELKNTTGLETIEASGTQRITINGNSLSGVFKVDSGVSAEIDNLTISGGRAHIGAGIDNQGSLTLRNDLITANSATVVGGSLNAGAGVANEGTSLVVIDTTITGNVAAGASANEGGGIYTSTGSVIVVESTIAGNTADVGGGIAWTGGVATRLSSSILAGNTATASATTADFFTTSTTLDASSSFDLIGIGDTTGLSNGVNQNLVGSAGSPLNAQLQPLAFNGGATQTLAVSTTSPAVHAGAQFVDQNNVLVTVDQRGIARVVGSVDIGAYQSSNPRISSITLVSPANGGVTNADSVTFAVTFNMPVQGVVASDFTTNAGTVSAVVPVNATTYDVIVNGLGSFTGTLTLGVAGSQTITDQTGLAMINTVPIGTDINTVSINHASGSFSFTGEYAVTTLGSTTVSLASITQAGAALTLSGTTTASATAGSGTTIMLSTGTATYADGKITFSADSPFPLQTWTKLDVPANFTTAAGAQTHVFAAGTGVTFVDQNGVSHSGSWVSPTQLVDNTTGVTATVGDGKLAFSNGTIWYSNLSLSGTVTGTASGSVTLTSTSPQIVRTDFTNAFGVSTHLIQNGSATAIFVDGLGRMSLGHFFNATQANVDLYPNDVATVNSNGTITWQDGGVWTTSSASSQVTVTDYFNSFGVATHIVTNGTNQAALIDGRGNFSLGHFTDSTHAVFDLYAGDTATILPTEVIWADGYVYVKTSTPPLTATADVNGSISHLKVLNSTTFVGIDGSLIGIVGTRLNGNIILSNGQTWTNLDPASLNAFFEMSAQGMFP